VRGLRYKLENSNVGHVVFADTQKQAAALAEKNSKLNGLGKSQYKIAKEDINKLLGRGDKFELIEIDPFGTPMPYLASVMRCGLGLDERFVSITATDTAVLCGAHAHACYKIYAARPLHSEICHEAGLRILLASIARAAAIEDWALKPMLCISHKHYFKVLAKLERGADAAVEAAKSSMYYITHCPHCLYHEIGKFPKNTCPFCQNRTSFAGPLWKGSWASKEVAGKMIELAKMRQYITKEAGLLLHTIFAEAEGPALYYDLHELASKHKRIIPSSAQIIEELQKQGYFASKTHFCQHAIRTDAMLGDILDKMQKR
jgi:tRNA (guanine26-N2/guanine27-N2)-dimethyltransferase